jgi:hypothetical protein
MAAALPTDDRSAFVHSRRCRSYATMGVAGALLGLGCEGPRLVGLAVVAKAELTPHAITVGVGDSTRLSASLFDARGRVISSVKRIVTWHTTDAQIARVGASGWVYGVAPGVTLVHAESNQRRDSAVVTVR